VNGRFDTTVPAEKPQPICGFTQDRSLAKLLIVVLVLVNAAADPILAPI
jgi:hypothetical protein